jgi:transposase-like protein
MKKKNEVTARKIYSHAFKMQVVQEYDNGQISKRGLSIKYRINPSTVDRWLENYSILAKNKRMAEKHSNDPKYKVKRLEKRIEELEAMLEIDDLAWEIMEDMTGDRGLRKKYLPKSQIEDLKRIKEKRSRR